MLMDEQAQLWVDKLLRAHGEQDAIREDGNYQDLIPADADDIAIRVSGSSPSLTEAIETVVAFHQSAGP
ncbi:MAG: hypothetical protein MI861_26650 [Pirellulales bacterium]|nr:hypothetical protein [Pirellulales bacterium]